jgi:hypothetical protein
MIRYHDEAGDGVGVVGRHRAARVEQLGEVSITPPSAVSFTMTTSWLTMAGSITVTDCGSRMLVIVWPLRRPIASRPPSAPSAGTGCRPGRSRRAPRRCRAPVPVTTRTAAVPRCRRPWSGVELVREEHQQQDRDRAEELDHHSGRDADPPVVGQPGDAEERARAAARSPWRAPAAFRVSPRPGSRYVVQASDVVNGSTGPSQLALVVHRGARPTTAAARASRTKNTTE